MSAPHDSNRQNRMVWIILGLLGGLLCIVGWSRYMM
jgi:hypothetical protein